MTDNSGLIFDPQIREAHRERQSRSYILRDNLAMALRLAIDSLAASEAKHGPDFKSGGRAGFEQVLNDLKAGKYIEVR